MAEVRNLYVRLSANVASFRGQMVAAGRSVEDFADRLDSSSDRMANLVQWGLALGPALVPLAAGAVPAVAGLATQLGFAAAGAGTAALAFSGMGDALDAVSKFSLEPTTDNYRAMREELDKLGPEAQHFVEYLDGLRPVLAKLREASQGGLLPGVEDGVDDLLTKLPQIESILRNLSGAMGDMARQAGGELADDPQWVEFFTYLETEARPMLVDFSRTLGNFIKGTASLFVAFNPVAADFSTSLLDSSRAFAQWADTVDETDGFRDFVDYVQQAGPEAWDTFVALSSALLDVLEAAAPVGQVALPTIRTLAEVLSAVADSPAGPVLIGAAAGISAVSRAVALYRAANGSQLVGMLGRLKGMPGVGAGATAAAAGIGALALSMTDLDEKAGVSNTALFAMMGMVAGPWGAAFGAAAGAIQDARSANDEFVDSLEHANDVLRDQPGQFEAQQNAIAKTQQAYEDFRDSITGDNVWEEALKSFKPSAMKDQIEGAFGDSDLEEMVSGLDKLKDAQREQMQSYSALGNVVRGNPWTVDYTKNLDELSRIATSVQPALDALGLTIDDLDPDSKGFEKNATAVRDWLREADSIPGRTTKVASAIGSLDDELLSTADSASELANALKELLGPGLDAEEATDAWRMSLRGLREEMAGTTRTFVGNTNAAIKNREATRGYTESVVEMLTKRAEAGASSEKIAALVQKSREAFIDEGVALGFSRDQMVARANAMGLTPKLVRTIFDAVGLDETTVKARALAAEFNRLPKDVRTDVAANGIPKTKSAIDALAKKYHLTPKQVRTLIEARDNASVKIDKVTGKAKSIPNPHIKITADGSQAMRVIDMIRAQRIGNKSFKVVTNHVDNFTRFVNRSGKPNEDGGLYDGRVRAFADGGYGQDGRYYSRTPQIVKGGANILWGEQATGWEAYVSGKPGMRARNIGVLSEAARRFGYDLSPRGRERVMSAAPYVAAQVGGQPLIGALTVPVPKGASVRETVGAVMYEVRRIKRGGRWS